MFKYVDICVDMKAGRKCKDALINYRNACQQVNVGSLEEVIKYLLKVCATSGSCYSTTSLPLCVQACTTCMHGQAAYVSGTARLTSSAAGRGRS